jgi:hypothetical protein
MWEAGTERQESIGLQPHCVPHETARAEAELLSAADALEGVCRCA